MKTERIPAIELLLREFSGLPEVIAIGLGGSQASGTADSNSDYDLYIFTKGTILVALRRELALHFDPAPEIGNPWWGDEDAWSAQDIGYDVMFWDAKGYEQGLRRVIEQHRPSLGYSTSFWFTMRNAVCLYDGDGWFARMKALAESPYHDGLRDAIITFNAPLLRSAHASYRNQIELAVTRTDPVSVNHRVAALLGSVFDIVFAATKTLHPGEKRQLNWLNALGDQIPAALDHHVRSLLVAAGNPEMANILSAVDIVCDDLDMIITRVINGPQPR